MIRRPPRSTRTDTLFPYTTLFRSFEVTVRSDGDSGLTLDPASGVIKWLPTTVGSYRFEGVVTDDGTPPRSVDVAYPINVVNPAEVPGVVGLEIGRAHV